MRHGQGPRIVSVHHFSSHMAARTGQGHLHSTRLPCTVSVWKVVDALAGRGICGGIDDHVAPWLERRIVRFLFDAARERAVEPGIARAHGRLDFGDPQFATGKVECLPCRENVEFLAELVDSLEWLGREGRAVDEVHGMP
jgi:hypothetical protein